MLEAQQILEEESRALGISRYRKRRSKWDDVLGDGVDEAALPPGRRLLRLALVPTIDTVSRFLETARAGAAGRKHSAIRLLDGVAPEPLAYLTLRCAIQSGVQRQRLQSAAMSVANAVIGHMEAESFAMVNKAGALGLEKALSRGSGPSHRKRRLAREIYCREGVSVEWDRREKMLVGSKLIELAVEATGLFELVPIKEGSGKRTRKYYELHLTEKADDWLERQHARCELLDPIPMPMVVEPRPWTTPTDGGYLAPPPGNSIVRHNASPYREELEGADMPLVYQAVNFIQSTAWKINQPILEAARKVWEGGGSLGGVPARDDEPLPPKPSNFDTDGAARDDWKRRASNVHSRNASQKGKRLALMQKIWVAQRMADHPRIYFPHNLDWRGRVYPIPAGGPSPQGDDIAKALLQFADGKPLGATGGRWLAIHLANLFGIDKVSFDDRVRWVEEHDAVILDSAENPLDGARFWSTAEKPWQALAACFEWAGYREAGGDFVSKLPIALDGSNSGLQHFTALLRDPEAAPHVNLVDREKPGDLYTVVADRVQAIVDASEDIEATAWKNGKVTRKVVKRPCMTYAFSASRTSMADQIERVLSEIDQGRSLLGNEPYLATVDNNVTAFWLAGVVYKEIEAAVPAAKRGMDWLKRTMRTVNKADVPIWWDSPAGLPILQRYPNVKSRSVEVVFKGQRLQLQVAGANGEPTLADWIDGPTTKSQNNREALSGIAPNFIHSLDAAHLMKVANACDERGIDALAVIHDSFGTHAAKTDELAQLLRETFVDLYESDPLIAFRAAVLDQLKDEPKLAKQIPALPDQGDLKLGEIMQARYMFS